jgi:hypothetical protein
MASRDHVALIATRLAINERQLLEAAEGCSDADLTWRPGPTSPPIAFHLWHCGRWTDRWAQVVSGADQRWQREGLSERWGFPDSLGKGDTGMQLPDDEAADLPFPPGAELAAYLRGAFADMDAAIATLDDAALLVSQDDLQGAEAPLGDSLIRHLAHSNRHLGMVEALRGLRGGQGTATV